MNASKASQERHAIIDWLLAGDPAIRWQALRDLCAAPGEETEAERQKVALEGWGAELLLYQDPAGTWGGGLYGPKWISTTYTLLSLRQLGLAPENSQAQAGCRLLYERGLYKDGGINYFKSMKTSEACVTGMVLSILAYFHYPEDLETLVKHLLGRQMEDGGWNCEDYKGATHSSFHTTISVLEGLEEFRKMQRSGGVRGQGSWGARERGGGGAGEQGGKGEGERGKLVEAIEAAQERAHEFLLAHRLYRSHRTGVVFDGRMLRFPFPPRWRYDILRALDYFRGWQPVKGNNRLAEDERLVEAVQVLLKKRLPDGRWNAHAGMSGRIYFEMEKAGQPGRWNTLRGLRVLDWWEAAR